MNEFANPFINEFKDNNDNNNKNNDDNKKFFFNPYSDRDNNNNNNPFEDNINNNPFVNNFGQQNFNSEEPNNNSNYQINKNQNNINNNNNNYYQNNQNFKMNNNNYNNTNYNTNNNFNAQNNYNMNDNNNFNINTFNPEYNKISKQNNNNSNNQNNNYNNNMNSNNFNNVNSNNKFDNNQKEKNIPQESSNDNDIKKIKAIISKCESVANTAKIQFDAFDIREAIATICKAIKGLDTLKNTINTQKQNCSHLLPLVTAIRNKSFTTLQEYRIMVYRIIPIRFKPVLYKPYENQNESLINFCSNYILNKPFISFDDIYENEETKKIRNNLNSNLSKAQKAGNKCFLIYGPKGCGKTLYVHALANQMGAKIAQIEGIELFKIPYFSREFIKACFGNLQLKPLIIYMKNIDPRS